MLAGRQVGRQGSAMSRAHGSAATGRERGSSHMSEVEAVAAREAEPAFGRRRDVMIVLPGLLLALILAMLDQLVVSTALPRIVGDLGGLNHLSWVVTAYVLASTIT